MLRPPEGGFLVGARASEPREATPFYEHPGSANSRSSRRCNVQRKSKTSRRVERVASRMKFLVSHIIQQDLDDPRLGIVTVLGVKPTEDLKEAKIYVSVLGARGDKSKARHALEDAKGFIQREVGKNLATRNTPTLHFVFEEESDQSKVARIESLIREANEEDHGVLQTKPGADAEPPKQPPPPAVDDGPSAGSPDDATGRSVGDGGGPGRWNTESGSDDSPGCENLALDVLNAPSAEELVALHRPLANSPATALLAVAPKLQATVLTADEEEFEDDDDFEDDDFEDANEEDDDEDEDDDFDDFDEDDDIDEDFGDDDGEGGDEEDDDEEDDDEEDDDEEDDDEEDDDEEDDDEEDDDEEDDDGEDDDEEDDDEEDDDEEDDDDALGDAP